MKTGVLTGDSEISGNLLSQRPIDNMCFLDWNAEDSILSHILIEPAVITRFHEPGPVNAYKPDEHQQHNCHRPGLKAFSNAHGKLPGVEV